MTTTDRIAEIRARWAGVGPWYPRATDDDVFMNARYVSTEPGPTNAHGEWKHDNKRGMGSDCEDSGKVIAITLLQSPRLADHEDCDENMERMAGAPDDIRDILAALDAATAERDDAEKLMLDAVSERNDFVLEAHKAKAERDAALARVAELEGRQCGTCLWLIREHPDDRFGSLCENWAMVVEPDFCCKGWVEAEADKP